MSTISVAMATYNGEAFLPGQLASLAEQQRVPDELVVCDDGSTDRTLDILHEFARSAPFQVHIHQNPRTLGASRNFEKAVSLCHGDFIALCDQDDVWLPHKIARSLEALEMSPSAGLVFTDALVVDDNLRPLGVTMWQTVSFDRRRQNRVRQGRALEVLTERNVVTGATLMFRSEYRQVALPFAPHWVHDAWLALVIALYADLALVPEPTMLYRQHGHNVIGIPQLKSLDLHDPDTDVRAALKNRKRKLIANLQRETREKYRLLYEHLLHEGRIAAADGVPRLHPAPGLSRREGSADGFLQHLKARGYMPVARLARIPVIARELSALRYHRYSRRRVLPLGLTAALADLVSAFDSP